MYNICIYSLDSSVKYELVKLSYLEMEYRMYIIRS